MSPIPLFKARNDILQKWLGDPTNDARRRWMALQSASGVAPDLIERRYADRESISFLLLGDPGEGDASQYCVVPGLLAEAEGTSFMFIVSDVVYPAGDAEEYEDKFYRPYRAYPSPIFAIPGNHDWYDGLNGFMRHFCGAEGRLKEPAAHSDSSRLRGWLRRLLWRDPPHADEDKLRRMRGLRGAPEQQARQPGPYFALDAGPIRLVGIDTGIKNELDRDQGAWLKRTSLSSPRPKILLTGKPIYVDGRHASGNIEGTAQTIDDIVRVPEHNYIAVIGGDIHNYQRYPVRLPDKRTIQYVVAGGGGAFMHGTHRIPLIDLPGVNEQAFRCYPRRADSLSMLSRIYGLRTLFDAYGGHRGSGNGSIRVLQVKGPSRVRLLEAALGPCLVGEGK